MQSDLQGFFVMLKFLSQYLVVFLKIIQDSYSIFRRVNSILLCKTKANGRQKSCAQTKRTMTHNDCSLKNFRSSKQNFCR